MTKSYPSTLIPCVATMKAAVLLSGNLSAFLARTRFRNVIFTFTSPHTANICNFIISSAQAASESVFSMIFFQADLIFLYHRWKTVVELVHSSFSYSLDFVWFVLFSLQWFRMYSGTGGVLSLLIYFFIFTVVSYPPPPLPPTHFNVNIFFAN